MDKNRLQKEQHSIKGKIKMLESDCETQSEAIQHYMNFRDITDITRNVLSMLVDEILIDSEKNITVNFKFRDEIKQYYDLLNKNND